MREKGGAVNFGGTGRVHVRVRVRVLRVPGPIFVFGVRRVRKGREIVRKGREIVGKQTVSGPGPYTPP